MVGRRLSPSERAGPELGVEVALLLSLKAPVLLDHVGIASSAPGSRRRLRDGGDALVGREATSSACGRSRSRGAVVGRPLVGARHGGSSPSPMRSGARHSRPSPSQGHRRHRTRPSRRGTACFHEPAGNGPDHGLRDRGMPSVQPERPQRWHRHEDGRHVPGPVRLRAGRWTGRQPRRARAGARGTAHGGALRGSALPRRDLRR